MKLEAGDKVNIYEDPITEQRREGQARLVECMDRDAHGDGRMERWIVDFGDGQEVARAIRVR